MLWVTYCTVVGPAIRMGVRRKLYSYTENCISDESSSLGEIFELMGGWLFPRTLLVRYRINIVKFHCIKDYLCWVTLCQEAQIFAPNSASTLQPTRSGAMAVLDAIQQKTSYVLQQNIDLATFCATPYLLASYLVAASSIILRHTNPIN